MASDRKAVTGRKWAGAPAGTPSLAITLYDPDAPTGSGWWHWVMYNKT